MKLEDALEKSENKTESPAEKLPAIYSTVDGRSPSITSKPLPFQPMFNSLFSPGALPFPGTYSGPLSASSFQLPAMSPMYDQAQRRYQVSDSSPLVIGESPGLLEGSFKPDLVNGDSKSTTSTDGFQVSSANSVSSIPTSVESYAVEMSEFDKELGMLEEKLTALIESTQLDPEFVRLLNGKQFSFNAYDLYPEEGFYAKCDQYQYFGMFSWRAYCRMDSSLHYLWSFVDNKISSTELATFCKPVNTSDGGMKGELNRSNIEKGQLNMGESVKDTGKTLGLNVQSDYSDNLSLIAKIEMSLPNRKVIWKLIDIYFEGLYPRLPFSDEKDFKAAVVRLIGSDINETQPLIKINEDIDFADLGILLIMLRLSYLSLFCTDNKENEIAFNSEDPDPRVQEKKYLLNHPINVETFFFSQQCLNKFNLFNVTDIRVLLLLLYTYSYRIMGPEFGMEPESNTNHTMLGLLFQIAISLGLHRDPARLDKSLPSRLVNIRRKIWFYINMEDLVSSYTIGLPLRANTVPSDCKPPTYSINADESNLSNLESEMVNQKMCKLFNQRLILLLQNFIVEMMDISKNHKIEDIVKQSTILEKVYEFFHQQIGVELFQSKDLDFFDMVKYKVHLATHGSHLSAIFQFFSYFDKLNETELSFYFLYKIFKEYLPVLTELNYIMKKSNKLVTLIIAAALIAINKINFIVIGVLLRLRIFMSYHTILPENMQYYEKLKNSLTQYLEYLLKFVNMFSDKYYYSWFINKSTQFVMKSLDDIVSNQEAQFFKLKSNINLDIMKDVLRVALLNCAVTGINEDLKNFENRSTKPFLDDNIDHLWLYLNAMNNGETSTNVGILDAILRDLDNIN